MRGACVKGDVWRDAAPRPQGEGGPVAATTRVPKRTRRLRPGCSGPSPGHSHGTALPGEPWGEGPGTEGEGPRELPLRGVGGAAGSKRRATLARPSQIPSNGSVHQKNKIHNEKKKSAQRNDEMKLKKRAHTGEAVTGN